MLGQTGENLEDQGIPCVRGVRERGGTYDNFSSYHQMLAVIYFPYALFLRLCLTFARIVSHVLQDSLQQSVYERGITARMYICACMYVYICILRVQRKRQFFILSLLYPFVSCRKTRPTRNALNTSSLSRSNFVLFCNEYENKSQL